MIGAAVIFQPLTSQDAHQFTILISESCTGMEITNGLITSIPILSILAPCLPPPIVVGFYVLWVQQNADLDFRASVVLDTACIW